jgi:hypothetical protein
LSGSGGEVFGQLEVGTRFTIRGHLDRATWRKTGRHQACLVNQSDTVRNMGFDEPVTTIALPHRGSFDPPLR